MYMPPICYAIFVELPFKGQPFIFMPIILLVFFHLIVFCLQFVVMFFMIIKEDALRAFIAPEILDGNNQVRMDY